MTYAFVADDIYVGPCGLHMMRTQITWQDEKHATLAFWAIGDKVGSPPTVVQTFKKQDIITCEDEAVAQDVGMRIDLALAARKSAFAAASEKFKVEIDRLRNLAK